MDYFKNLSILFALFIGLSGKVVLGSECENVVLDKESDPFTGNNRYSPTILQEVLSLRGPDVIVVLDLDSTLVRVAPRNLQIIKDFAQTPQFASKYGKETAFLLSLERQPGIYQMEIMGRFLGIDRTLSFLGLSQTHPDFYLDFIEFLKVNSNNGYLHHDVPYEGAVGFVNQIYNNGVRIIYLTGRDTKRMGEGTPLFLRRHHFPLDGFQAQLIMKPVINGSISEADTAEFKVNTLRGLSERNLIYFFENEPSNINLVHRSLPHIRSVYFESTHAIETEEVVDNDIPRIRSYQL